MKTKIATYLTIPIVSILAWLLIMSVKGPIDLQNRVIKQQNDVTKKLKFLRVLQKAYLGKYGKYAGKWEDLVEFAKTGQIPNIVRRDVKTNVEGQYKTVIDTVGVISVADQIMKKYPEYPADDIPTIPNMSKDKKFELYAGTKDMGKDSATKFIVQVFQIKDIYPLDENRGAFFNEKGEPINVNNLIGEFTKRKEEKEKEAKKYQDDMDKMLDVERNKIKGGSKTAETIDSLAQATLAKDPSFRKNKDQWIELSKYINLNRRRIEKLEKEPLQIGSREEATDKGNWE
ncbi:MAG: hypothetical protein EAZ85_07220 [Bacteroidetes bacterium]|nr:MAG: hypothetical protein EAZ85_07220 [Bacteroidota bacterium]TAG85404.1 MAG: hypothetical protein EAZ20_15225 [Bacteroidota bacterium]